MKQLLLPIALIAFAACGDQTSKGTEAASTNTVVGAARSKPWVDQATLEALPKDANSISKSGEPVTASGDAYVAMARNLSSDDKQTRITAVRAISLTMAGAKSDYATALDQQIPRYLSTHAREFLGLFNPPNNMGKIELQAWAERLRGGPKSTGLTTEASEILRGMKSVCSDCTQSEIEVLDLFVGMATGRGGKGGKGGLK
ncbi:MAG: hypothetical protein IPO17_05685 [Flavobacteriales bacterium]|nr:hypothetical protein [Flavobacteriales bacterium]